jgi:flavin-dependent dehydrogenase
MRDVIVIGGGPAGSTAATLLARRGHSVLLLERERFPRFQVGESLLPYNNDLFERLGVKDQLLSGEFSPKYGAEFVTADGRVGYTFRFDRNLPDARYHRSFQVRRSEFDHLLLRNAAQNGVEVREQTAVTAVELTDASRAVVRTADGGAHEARFVLDASGHGAVLGNRIGEKAPVESLKKIAIFAHFRGVPRAGGRDAGNTVIVVLRDSWFWLIPVTDELMSVGLVVDRDHVARCGMRPEELLARTIAETPYMAERMKDAERTTPVHARKDFSYAMRRMVGPNFALIGDAAGFLDPIFSTGVFMAMKSADIAAVLPFHLPVLSPRVPGGLHAAEGRLRPAADDRGHSGRQRVHPARRSAQTRGILRPGPNSETPPPDRTAHRMGIASRGGVCVKIS